MSRSLLVLLALVGRACASAGGATIHLELSPVPDESSAHSAAASEDVVHWRGQLWIVRERSAASAEHASARVLEETEAPPSSEEFWTSLAVSVFLIIVAGIMAGSTLGITGLDPLTLRLKELEGSPAERKWASSILPITSKHHHLLVTLLLCNAGANEALPIFLDRIVDAKTAVLISVTCVLLFGEVLPSAVMTGPHQLRFAAALVPLVRVLMTLTWPISFPIAKLLDVCLGKHGAVSGYKRKEFKALVKMQHRQHTEKTMARREWSQRAEQPWISRAAKDAAAAWELSRRGSTGNGSCGGSSSSASQSVPPLSEEGVWAPTVQKRRRSDKLREALTTPLPSKSQQKEEEEPEDFSEDQVKILHSIFDLQTKVVGDLLHFGRNTLGAERAAGCKMLNVDQCLDYEMMDRIIRWGYSRIPVYRGNRHNIIGLLLVKEHLKLDPDDATPIRNLRLRPPCATVPSASIFDLLNVFQTGRSHLAVVSEDAALYEECWQQGRDLPAHARVQGICTIEDVVEEMIGEEVIDETDSYVERRSAIGHMGEDASLTEYERALAFRADDALLEGSDKRGGGLRVHREPPSSESV